MLKIVYSICAGLGVYKNFILACIASTDEKGITSYRHHRFATFTKGLRELAEWLKSYSCSDVCMESTEKYWIPIYHKLEQAHHLAGLCFVMLFLGCGVFWFQDSPLNMIMRDTGTVVYFTYQSDMSH